MGASRGGIRVGWAGVMVAVVAASLMLEGSAVAAATRHVVGGNTTGWTILPSDSSFYDRWSSSQTFAEGDTLVFNFLAGVHNVIEVPKSSYDACSAKNQIGPNLTASPATVTITSSGTYYYICGFSGHCSLGQKLAITTSSSASPTPAPTPGGSSSAPPQARPFGFSLAVAFLSVASSCLLFLESL